MDVKDGKELKPTSNGGAVVEIKSEDEPPVAPIKLDIGIDGGGWLTFIAAPVVSGDWLIAEGGGWLISADGGGCNDAGAEFIAGGGWFNDGGGWFSAGGGWFNWKFGGGIHKFSGGFENACEICEFVFL